LPARLVFLDAEAASRYGEPSKKNLAGLCSPVQKGVVMQPGIPITDGVHWVGLNDRQTALFESLWPIPNGISYNSYLILDEKVALIDGVKDLSVGAYLDKLLATLGPDRQVDYLVINHVEPDHSGAVAVLKRLFPHMRIVGNKKTAEFLASLYETQNDVVIVGDGEELSLGKRRLRFCLTPMVHWPETMMTYEPSAGILFSGDAFGAFGTLDDGIFDDQIDVAHLEDEILRYFSNIIGKYAPMAQKAIERVAGLDVKIVASAHGPVWRSRPQTIIDMYSRWSRYEAEPGVVLAFGSMYGQTARMADAVGEGLVESGVKTLRVHHVSTAHASYIVRDIWRYQGLILGCPTYDAGVFPAMDALLRLLADKRIARRSVAVFGTYGWSGGAVKALTAFVDSLHLELVEPVVEARFRATPDQLEQCRQLGRHMAARLHQ
jgi:flavorubredoxin